MNKLFVLLMAFILCSSCIVQRRSNFDFQNLQHTMTKKDVISKYGKPYKTSFTYDDQGVLCEELFYKETLYKDTWYEINNILHFKDGKLVSLQQGQERRLFNDTTIITK